MKRNCAMCNFQYIIILKNTLNYAKLLLCSAITKPTKLMY